MKKFYSIVLMACAMLVSANIWAVDVTTRQQIQDAINNTPVGGTVDIRLMNNIDVDATIFIYAKYAEAGRTVNLDLNGYNMVVAGPTMIKLLKGTLNITGTGVLEKTGKTEADLIVVGGSYKETDANWSNLTIGKDVELNAHAPASSGKETSNAISVLEIYSLTQSTYSLVGGAAITDPMDAAQLAAAGVNFNTVPAAYKMNGEAMLDYTSGWYKYNTTAVTSGTYAGKYKKNTSSVLGYAYGVNIEILGKVYGSKYGIKINGNIRTSGANIPYVHIASSAEVYSAPQTGNSVAVYSSGVGRFEIEGYVHGASGVYVKAGSVELNDAVVKSDFTGDHNMPVGKTSGVSAGGSAITIESNKSYGGNHEVVIKGDTKVEGGSGFAIEESITTSSASNVSEVKIEGGTFVAGGEGAIVITDKTAAEAKVEIVGGNVENLILIEEDGNYTAAEVSDFVPAAEADHFKTTAVTDDAGKTTIVVTYFENTADKPVDATSVKDAADNTGVAWISTADVEETLIEDKELTYLEAIDKDHKQVLNVGDEDHNVTLIVGRIVLGPKAKIVVAAGSTLIVDGEQGIVADLASNIELNTEEGNPSIFIFNPAVTSNRHPQATVKYTSKAYRKANGDNIYQFFGSPFTAVESVVASSNTYATQIDVWNRTAYDRIGIINYDKVGLDASNAINYSKFDKAFGFYSMMTNNPEGEEQTYTFTGRLIGNENPEIPMYANWAAMSNSYMGTINLDALMEANRVRRANGSKVNVTPYVYAQEGNELHWNANNPLVAGYITEIAPMQPFMLKNDGDYEDIVNNYEDLVWNPANPASAPARRNIAADMTKATIRVNGNGMSDMLTIAESVDFTSGRDDLDAVMYPNTDINFYAMADEKMSVLATDDVENTYLGFACPKGGEFTLTFNGVEGKALTLVDLVNNTSVDMTEGATYTFTAAANEVNDYRFKVVGRNNAATALENTNAAAKAEGIYTLTGMYLGNMSVWNTLPAGIYVVNGEKMVK